MMRIEDKEDGSSSLSYGFDKIIKKKRPELFSFDNFVPSLEKIRGKIWIWPGYNWSYKGFSIKAKIRTGWLVR